MQRLSLALAAVLTLAACGGEQPADVEETSPATTPASSEAEPSEESSPSAESATPSESDVEPVTDFETTEHGEFNQPWSMEFLPETSLLLIAEKGGTLQLRDQESGEVRQVQGVPEVYSQGQAGLHDVIAGPDFTSTGQVFLSWVEQSDGGPRGIVATATLDTEAPQLDDVQPIWQQDPGSGDGHFSLRLLVHDGYLFVTSGERQEMDPAQDHGTNKGKVLRLELDGTPAADNPLGNEGVEAQFYTLGHRNPLGIDVDSAGNIWVSEMGPQGGDELNLIEPGNNYGWPEASMGQHYDGTDIPDHTDDDNFTSPAAYWVPAISPGSLEIYSGDLFAGWKDSALLGGLSGQTLVRVALDGDTADIADDWEMGERIRAVEEAPDGSIWLLEDGDAGRLLELRPA